VDFLDQTEYRRGKPKTPVAEARFLGRIEAPGLDVLCGSAISPRYDALHVRRVLFVAGEYWVFEDTLSASRSHRYDQRWHLAPPAQGRVRVRTSAAGALALAPGLALVFAPGVRLTVEEGWYAPRYGVKHPAPVICAVRDGEPNARMIVVAVPLAPGDGPPRLDTVEHDGEHTTVVIEGATAGARDTVRWSADGSAARWDRTEAVRR
jgi:hypothetical protein